jgi:hypothetical protein
MTLREWLREYGVGVMFVAIPVMLILMALDEIGISLPLKIAFIPYTILTVTVLVISIKYPTRTDLPEYRVRRRLQGLYGDDT